MNDSIILQFLEFVADRDGTECLYTGYGVDRNFYVYDKYIKSNKDIYTTETYFDFEIKAVPFNSHFTECYVDYLDLDEEETKYVFFLNKDPADERINYIIQSPIKEEDGIKKICIYHNELEEEKSLWIPLGEFETEVEKYNYFLGSVYLTGYASLNLGNSSCADSWLGAAVGKLDFKKTEFWLEYGADINFNSYSKTVPNMMNIVNVFSRAVSFDKRMNYEFVDEDEENRFIDFFDLCLSHGLKCDFSELDGCVCVDMIYTLAFLLVSKKLFKKVFDALNVSVNCLYIPENSFMNEPYSLLDRFCIGAEEWLDGGCMENYEYCCDLIQMLRSYGAKNYYEMKTLYPDEAVKYHEELMSFDPDRIQRIPSEVINDYNFDNFLAKYAHVALCRIKFDSKDDFEKKYLEVLKILLKTKKTLYPAYLSWEYKVEHEMKIIIDFLDKEYNLFSDLV